MKWFISLTLVAGVLVTAPAFAEEIDSAIARGGKLYDKWYVITKADTPKTSHPLYPSDKAYAEKPDSNWRCKECHGWDYQGKDGAYASGKHATGIVGIGGMAGAETEAIVALLTGEAHGLGNQLSTEDARDLALFISQGQIDMDQYIDRTNKAPKGDAAQGAAYFNTICAGCHGRDGTLPKDMSKPLGGQMGNPWEVMHKILNGQPGEAMPALRALDRQITVDIMAHMATLPKEK